MKGIDPKWAMYLGLLVTIEQAIGHGTVSLTNLVPASWAPYITSWCNFLAFIGTAIMTYQAAVSAPLPGPAANTPISPVVKSLILLLLAILVGCLSFTGTAQAQTPRARPVDPGQQFVDKLKQDFTAKTGVQATGDVPFDLLRALDAKLLPDLQYALKLATATNNNITAVCYQAWIDVISVQQTAVQVGTPPADIPIPDPHIITDFERAVELRNMLQPDSKFMTSCSPVANLIKQDVLNFMGKVVGGSASLATLVPGL